LVGHGTRELLARRERAVGVLAYVLRRAIREKENFEKSGASPEGPNGPERCGVRYHSAGGVGK